MDLLKPDDIEKNSQVIVTGYGITYELDQSISERELRFTRLNMFMEQSLNMTIYYRAPYTKVCGGMY